MKTVRGVSLVLALALMLTLVSCGNNANTPDSSGNNSSPKTEVKVMKVTNAVAEDHPFNIALQDFKAEIEEKTGGAILVDIYPNAQLADDVGGIDQCKMGAVQCHVAMGQIGTFKEAGTAYGCLEDLPFLFSNLEEARAAYDGKLGQVLADHYLESAGVITLTHLESGFRHFTNNVRPIYTPEDLAGIKFRVASSEIRTETFKTLGSSPIFIALNELFTALQQGTVSGQENPLSMIQAQQFYEVQRYLSLTGHIYSCGLMMINPDFYNGLTAEQQEIVQTAATNLSHKIRELNEENDKIVLEFLEEQGMEINNADVDAFREAVQPVLTYYTDKYGADAEMLLEAALNP